MITITKIETTYPAPDDDEEDYCPDGDAWSETFNVSFRELVDLMRDYSFSSGVAWSAPPWGLSNEPYQDPYSGEWTENSLHYSPDNSSKNAKYWRAALRAAGIIK